MRLATKFIALLLIGTLILLAVDGYLTGQHEIDIFEEDMERDAELLCGSLQALVMEVWDTGGEQRAVQLIEEANKRRTVSIRRVWLDAPPNHPSQPRAARNRLSAVATEKIITIRHSDEEGSEHLLTYGHLAIGGPRPVALELAEPLTQTDEMQRYFLVRTVSLSAITVLLGLALVFFLGAEMVGKPLRLLTEKTRRIGHGDLTGPVTLNRRDEFGELAGAINSMCDQLLTAQKKAQEQTAARIATLEELRHADRLRTVGRLASGIAHELGTPLNVVGARADMIASGDLSPEETRNNAEIIKQETDRITSIIRQLLDFARRNTPKRASVDLQGLVRQTLELLTPIAEKKGIILKSLSDSGAFPCHVDAGQIQQALTNLVVNAAQAMPDGGQVEIKVQRVRAQSPEADGLEPRNFYAISVQDQGPGITKENQEQLFEPFFTTKPTGEGTGLGLSIVHGIVQEHGGWIDVESAAEKGSCFTVYLPAEPM